MSDYPWPLSLHRPDDPDYLHARAVLELTADPTVVRIPLAGAFHVGLLDRETREEFWAGLDPDGSALSPDEVFYGRLYSLRRLGHFSNWIGYRSGLARARRSVRVRERREWWTRFVALVAFAKLIQEQRLRRLYPEVQWHSS